MKGEQDVWAVTLGPLDAGAYRYNFNVDGVATIDPRNPAISESNNNVWSLVDVPTTLRWFNTCTLTVAGLRQNCASDAEKPAFKIRAENSLDTTGARLEGVNRSEPFMLDMSFFKTLPLWGRTNFQVRLEAFNILNNVQWPNPNTTVTSPLLGTVTETQSNDPRFVQLAFRLTF